VITGVHAILLTTAAEEVRAFLRDGLELPAVDAGAGWLIFALPPAELAAHPDAEGGRRQLYLMCDDIAATVADLESRGVEMTGPVEDAPFGRLTGIRLPDGSELGLYEPRHPTALDLEPG
jgi:hypothetical protein